MVYKLEVSANSENVGRFRSIFSQIVASMSSFLLLFDLGMAINFSTIMIPALLNASEGLSLNEEEASWFGSVSFLSQPVGAILSGPVVDYFGRRKSNFLVNIPMIVAWILMYYSWNLPTLFIANALLGISSGIMEAPISCYIGEITEPSIRGALCALTQTFTAFGVLFMYFLGTFLEWRSAALVCLIAPVASMATVILSPETPIWLLTKNREKDALTSLCKLRGWTSPENVQEEFVELTAYSKKLVNCVICSSTNQDYKRCEHESMNWFLRRTIKFKYVMFCKETLRPLSLVVMYFLFFVMSGLTPLRPNLINISGALGIAQDGKRVVLMVGVITFVISFIVIGLIKILGKRIVVISALFASAVVCTLLSTYAKINLDDSVFSYNPSTFPKETSVLPLVLLYLLTIFTALGVPWVLLGELFPFRSRATSQGLSAASNYLFSFLGSKTFIDLETNIQLWGTFATYAAFGFLGSIYLYFFLPETEGKTLQEIEGFYNGELRVFGGNSVLKCLKREKR
ncbi:facilitated trehalose transporter Tret1-like [Melitaea cinxia]|uniref:facilitated trehalose transporter Tret1-like n=1 Tax=Melitaea cinxia TaxID=113334 RepID=UPI001E272E20|nr:facilitated trehalose transporter Tret1-like [Melitaea cinxia]